MSDHFVALVLAAGRSRRFGEDKLLRPLAGVPLVQYAIKAACAAPVDRVIIVKRPGALLDRACKAAADDGRLVYVDIESDALSDSLHAGLEAASGAKGVFVFLGDMPLAPHEVAGLLAQNLGEHFAAIAAFKGRWGHPVLLSARAAALAKDVRGDRGAGGLLREHVSELVLVEMNNARIVVDIDRPSDLERLCGSADDHLYKEG